MNLLKKIPGYTLVKAIMSGLHKGAAHPLRPVVLMLGTVERIGLEVRKLPDRGSMVFFPGAPGALTGSIQMLPVDRVIYLNVPIAAVMGLIENHGFGAGKSYKSRLISMPCRTKQCTC